jgi:GNAT superfamily N-acetyltransferase
MQPLQLPEGLIAHPVHLPDDGPAVIDLVRAYNLHHLDRPTEPPEETIAQIEQLHHATDDVLLVQEPASATSGSARLAALVVFEPDTSAGDPPEHWFDLYVRPGHPASGRLEDALTRTALHHAGTVLGRQQRSTAKLETGAARADTVAAAAFRRNGFAFERTFWEMTRSLSADADDPGPAPPGVRVRLGGQDDADRALIHRVVDTAFQDHWGYNSRDTDLWWARLRALVGTDARQWWVAELDGAAVGVCLGDASRAGEGGGYIRTLGVLREARGRGIGRHLLRVAFAEHRRRGWTFTALRVDSTSPTGAPEVYRSVGMAPTDILDLYARTVEVEAIRQGA